MEEGSKYQEWSTARIRALAPDEHTWVRAQRLAHPPVWLSRFKSEHLAWGECKGAEGATYFTEADLINPAFRCSCPSSRKPCKHALALLLLLENYPQSWIFTDIPPQKTADWSTQRQMYAAARALRKQDPENQAIRAKNREKRLQSMADGIEELDAWLCDLIRHGLAAAESQPCAFWEQMAARMVDAKLGAIAKRLRQLAYIESEIPRHTQILQTVCELFLLCEAFKRREKLPQELVEDLLTNAGLNQRKEDLEGLEPVIDYWTVRAVEEGKDEKELRYRRVWLQRHSALQFALLLDFAWGENPFEYYWKKGDVLEGGLVYFPSAFPLRAIPQTLKPTFSESPVLGGISGINQAAKAYAEALSCNPWLMQMPIALEDVVPVFHNQLFYLIDTLGATCLLDITEKDGIKLLAESGGHPIALFGVWKNGAFKALI